MSAEPTAATASDLAEALRWPPGSRKFRLLAGIVIGLFALYGIARLVVAVTRGWPAGFGDSFAVWSWGHFLTGHSAALIYDRGALRASQLALGLDPGASYPFAYPPSYLPLLWALGRLSGPLACIVLLGIGLPFWLWATFGRDWRSPALFAALALPTTAIEIASGQSGFLAAGLLAGGLRLAGRNPTAAGVLFGLLSYKPQLGLLVPLALIAARLWRTLAAAALTACALVIVTSMLFGAGIWPAWAGGLPSFSQQFAAESSQIVHLMPTPLAALTQLGIAPGLARIGQWVATFAAAAVVWFLFRAGADRLAGAGLLLAALLATPYAFVYDMPVVATAVIWLVIERDRSGEAFGTGEVMVAILVLLAPVALAAGTSRFPLAALSLILLLAAVVRRRVVTTLPPLPVVRLAAGSP